MKNTILNIVLFSLVILMIGACSKPHGSANSVSLYDCSNDKTEPFICFDSLISDSRCPQHTECVWRGTAIIKVTFHESGRSHQFSMSLKGYEFGNVPSDTSINGYHISFEDLKPYPDFQLPPPKETDIKASFIITR